MTARLRSRLEKLEAQMPFTPSNTFRYGWLKCLPKDYVGERHRVVIHRQPTRSPNFEWCEWEERAGPAPPGSEPQSCFHEG